VRFRSDLSHAQGSLMSSAAQVGTPPPQKLWNRHFTLFWIGDFQSNFGTALAGVALSFLVYRITNSAAAMGVTIALAMLPSLFSPLAGTLVDRIPLKIPLVLSNLLRGAAMLIVWQLAERQQIGVLVLFALSLFNGLIDALYSPATSSLVPRLVPGDQLARAHGLLGMSNQLANLVGLILGGVLVGFIGIEEALAANGATFLLMTVALMFVHMPGPVARAEPSTFWQDLRAGVDLVRRSRLLKVVTVMSFIVPAAFAPINMLLPKHMTQLGAGPQGYGLFLALFMVGMFLGSSLVTALGQRFDARRGIWTGMLGMGVAVGAMAFTTSSVLTVALALVTGLAMAIANTGISLLVQLSIEEQFYGRIFGLIGAVSQVAMPLTLLALTGVADQVSVATILGITGVTTLISGLTWIVVLGLRRGASDASSVPSAAD
jgi:MFS transporter, DHA3 family, macrolide efflux protein